jgi:hypothetical protein
MSGPPAIDLSTRPDAGGDDGFDAESWPLGERIGILIALALHQSFTVNWDIDVD